MTVLVRPSRPTAAEIHGAEEAPEVFPDRPGVVGVGVLVGPADGLAREQSAILAEGTEEDAVEHLLRAGEHIDGRHGGVGPAKGLEGRFPHVGVLT